MTATSTTSVAEARVQVAAHLLDPLDHAASEQAVRGGEEHDENDQEREGVLVGRADVAGTERFQQAEAEAPATAPSGLPMPPSMAAAKPLSARRVPTS